MAVSHNSTIITSPNATVWTAVPSPLPAHTILEEVAFGNGQYVAVGWNGTILTSPNGSTWTPQVSGTTSILFNFTHGGGQFVAVGQGGTILTSVMTVNSTLVVWNCGKKDRIFGRKRRGGE